MLSFFHSKSLGILIVFFSGKRLQMIVCSATLHSFEVKKMAERLMHFPTWVDLKVLWLFCLIFYSYLQLRLLEGQLKLHVQV